MKRLIIILMALCLSIYSFSNSSFDKTTNYQFHNVQSLVGELLYVVPLTGSNHKDVLDSPVNYYPNFMDYWNFYDDLGQMVTYNNYKFGVRGSIDSKVAGTHKDWLENHTFRVDEVVKIPNYKYMWVLYLTDVSTGDKAKYVLDTEKANTQIDIENFPFIVKKHFNYLRSLIGTNVIFATNKYKYDIWEFYVPCYFQTFKTDINTGEEIHYTTPYVKWEIKDVIYHTHDMNIYFIVTNGKNITKVQYDNPYTKSHSKYNVGNRVFPEKQWNELVNKYGEYHMSLIMQTESSEDMTLEEKYMSGGRRLVRNQAPNSGFNSLKNELVNVKNKIVNLFE